MMKSKIRGLECSSATSASMFLLGVTVGAGAALLLAPMSGHAMRGTISRRLNDGKRVIRDRVNETTEKAASFIHDSQAKATALMDEAHGMVDARVQQLADEKERIAAALRAGREAYRSTDPTVAANS